MNLNILCLNHLSYFSISYYYHGYQNQSSFYYYRALSHYQFTRIFIIASYHLVECHDNTITIHSLISHHLEKNTPTKVFNSTNSAVFVFCACLCAWLCVMCQNTHITYYIMYMDCQFLPWMSTAISMTSLRYSSVPVTKNTSTL